MTHMKIPERVGVLHNPFTIDFSNKLAIDCHPRRASICIFRSNSSSHAARGAIDQAFN